MQFATRRGHKKAYCLAAVRSLGVYGRPSADDDGIKQSTGEGCWPMEWRTRETPRLQRFKSQDCRGRPCEWRRTGRPVDDPESELGV